MSRGFFHGIEMPADFLIVIRQTATDERITDAEAFVQLAISGAECRRRHGKVAR